MTNNGIFCFRVVRRRFPELSTSDERQQCPRLKSEQPQISGEAADVGISAGSTDATPKTFRNDPTMSRGEKDDAPTCPGRPLATPGRRRLSDGGRPVTPRRPDFFSFVTRRSPPPQVCAYTHVQRPVVDTTIFFFTISRLRVPRARQLMTQRPV